MGKELKVYLPIILERDLESGAAAAAVGLAPNNLWHHLTFETPSIDKLGY